MTLPSHGNGFDIGLVGSGGIGAGWIYGVNDQYGAVTGNESDINSITVNANAAGALEVAL